MRRTCKEATATSVELEVGVSVPARVSEKVEELRGGGRNRPDPVRRRRRIGTRPIVVE